MDVLMDDGYYNIITLFFVRWKREKFFECLRETTIIMCVFYWVNTMSVDLIYEILTTHKSILTSRRIEEC